MCNYTEFRDLVMIIKKRNEMKGVYKYEDKINVWPSLSK